MNPTGRWDSVKKQDVKEPNESGVKQLSQTLDQRNISAGSHNDNDRSANNEEHRGREEPEKTMRGHIAGVVAVEPEHGSDCDHVADYEEGPTASDDECEYNVKRVAPMPVKDVSIKATFMALVQFFETVTLETLPPVRPNEARLPDEICELVLHHVSDTKTYNACLKVSRRFRLICQKSPLVMDDIVFQDLLPTYQAFSSSQENEDKKVTPGPQVPPDFLAVELSSGQQKSVWLEWGDSRTDALTCFVVAGNEWNRKTFIRQSITLQGLCSPLAGACETGKRTPM